MAILDRPGQFTPAQVAVSRLRSFAHFHQLRFGPVVLEDPEPLGFSEMLVDENALHACNRDVGTL